MNWIKRNAYYLAWLVALAATLGSLYFQYVLNFPPCVLCWFQRIAIYPLVLIIPVGIVRKDSSLPLYVLPLSIVGACVAVYHNLLYYNIIPESLAPCVQGISCTTKLIEWFGFITIPLLSLIAFIVVIFLMLVAWKGKNREQGN